MVIKKILVPTDFSSFSGFALIVASRIALRAGATLVLLHISEKLKATHHVPVETGVIPEGKDSIRVELDRLVQEAALNGIKAEAVYVQSQGADEIEDYIKPYEIDFIVMGSHGLKGIRSAIAGSSTRRLIRKAEVPVLVIKQSVDEKNQFKNIVFASTFRKDQSHALNHIVSFARYFESSIHVVFINLYYHLIREDVARETIARIMEKYKDVNYTVNISETNSEDYGIEDFAEKIDADLISVVMENHLFVGGFLNLSVADKLIQKQSKPVLVINPSDR